MAINPFYKNAANIVAARKLPELIVDDEEFVRLARADGWSQNRIEKEMAVSRAMPLGILIGRRFVKVR